MDNIIIEGLLTKIDEPNHNNEILPREVLKKALEYEDFKENLYWRVIYGSLRLNNETEPTTYNNAAFVLKEYDENFIGKFEVLDTIEGHKLLKMIEDGKQFTFSYNGGGLYHTDENGITVMDILNVESFDIIDIKD